MKIAKFISKLQKSIYQFSDINTKFASVIFTNVERNANFDLKFPAAKKIFYFNENQQDREVKTIENEKEIIQFNDSSYLGSYVNKIFKNHKYTATRFEYAFVEFKHKDYWQHIYEIVATMDLESSILAVRIKDDILKECLECELNTLEQYKSMFVQKFVNIGIMSIFQISLKSHKTLEQGTQLFVFRCLNSKEDIFYWNQRILFYKSDGIVYSQAASQLMNHKPETIVGEAYPQLE